MAHPWSVAELALLRTLREQGLTSEEISKHFAEAGLTRTQRAVETALRRHRIHAKVPESPVPPIEHLHVEGNALLLFDVHAPLWDHWWVNRVMHLALEWGIPQAVIGGDLMELDALSVFAKSPDFTLRDEIKALRQFVRVLTAEFDGVFLAMGNHEVRLARKLDWALDVAEAMEMLLGNPRVVTTPDHWLELRSMAQTYHVVHPRNLSAHATLVPKKLASKYLCHVIAGHGHTWGMARDDSDHFWCIDSGVCLDPQRLDYVQREHSTRAMVQQGAVIVKDGVPVLLSPHNVAFYEKNG